MAEGDPPRIDPTVLTTEALHREVNSLRELLDTRIDAVTALKEEKFRRVEQRFDLIERQRLEQKTDTKLAIDAALTAQKEAVKAQNDANQLAISKSESATAETLTALKASVTAITDSFYSRVNDLKDQVNRIENRKEGVNESFSTLKGIAALVVGALTLAVGYSALHHQAAAPVQTVPTVVTVPAPTVTVTTP